VHAAPAGAWSVEPLDVLRGSPVLVVAGVARPERFVATMRTVTGRSDDTLLFPDHHPYSAADAARIATAAGGRPVVTTEKDLAKLARFPVLDGVRALRVDLDVEDGDALVDLLAR
jgi:tetraacyldisaccharide 4'-kinase